MPKFTVEELLRGLETSPRRRKKLSPQAQPQPEEPLAPPYRVVESTPTRAVIQIEDELWQHSQD